jgi:hypothetical protein
MERANRRKARAKVKNSQTWARFKAKQNGNILGAMQPNAWLSQVALIQPQMD